MSDPLNSTVFGDSKISAKVVSSGLADSINRGKPGMNIATQLHTPLPRPRNISLPRSNSSSSNASSMEAVDRSRITIDPLAEIMSANFDNDGSNVRTPSPEVTVSPVDMYTAEFLGKISTLPVNVSLISRNVSGLHILASCSAWKHVIDLSLELMQGNPLNAYGGGDSLSVVFILRMIGLFRLKMLDELQQECCAVLAQEESRLVSLVTGVDYVVDAEKGGAGTFLNYPRPPNGGGFHVDNLVSLQLLFVEVKVVTGRGDEALNLLYMLKQWLSTPEDLSSVVPPPAPTSDACRVLMWKWKVVWALINVLIRQRLWRQSIKEMLSILEEMQRLKDGSAAAAAAPAADDEHVVKNNKKITSAEVMVLCRIARTLIQIGALKSAGLYLDKASALFSEASDGSTANAVLETHVLVTKGLLCFSNDQFTEACNHFSGVVDLAISPRASNSSSAGDYAGEGGGDGGGGGDEEGGRESLWMPTLSLFAHRCAGVVEMEQNLLPIAVNNFAVCSLHLRRIKAAVLKMEELIQDDPARHMVDPVIFNLCTMYDLSFGPDVSTDKKQTLQIIAEKYNIDDLHWRSFRLN